MDVERMETVYVEREDHRIDIVIDRPDHRNSLSRTVVRELTEAFEIAQELEDGRAITLTGEGPVFCAGMDLDMMSGADEAAHHDIVQAVNALFDSIDDCDIPVVVGIKGAGVAGGFELTLPADLRVLGEDAKYAPLETKIGLFPAGGTTQRLPRLVGLTNAKEIVLLADYIDPDEAKQMGLVNEVCADDEVDERTREIADELTRRSPLGVQRALQSFQNAFDMPLEEGLQRERDLCSDLFATHDAKEGFAARLEGREPEFEGR